MTFNHNLLIKKTGFFAILYVTLCTLPGSLPGRDLSTVGNCSKAVPDFNDGELLTREERIKRMDQAFDESLTKFEECPDENPVSASGAAGAAGNEGLTGSEAQEQEEDGQTPTTAPVKSRELSGDEPKEKINASEEPVLTKNVPSDDDALDQQEPPLSNGKLPDDIPAAANDDAFAAQLRQAAQAEQDPQKQARLWNEYRKYKGLQEKPLSE